MVIHLDSNSILCTNMDFICYNFSEIMEELKEVERAYCDFIERRHLTSLDNIPLMDVSQIYAKYNHPKLLEDISKLKRSSEEVNYIMKTSKSN